jgi:hypothetical protein
MSAGICDLPAFSKSAGLEVSPPQETSTKVLTSEKMRPISDFAAYVRPLLAPATCIEEQSCSSTHHENYLASVASSASVTFVFVEYSFESIAALTVNPAFVEVLAMRLMIA